LQHEKGAKVLNGLERKPGEGIDDGRNGRKFQAVKTNIIMDLEEKAMRQKAVIDMKKERQKNKRRKNKKPGDGYYIKKEKDDSSDDYYVKK